MGLEALVLRVQSRFRLDIMRKNLSDKRLINLYKGQRLTTGQIARIYGYTRQGIRQRLRRLCIDEVNSRGKAIDVGALRHMYVELHLPMKVIAAKMRVSKVRLNAELRRLEINRPAPVPALDQAIGMHNRAEVEDLYIRQ